MTHHVGTNPSTPDLFQQTARRAGEAARASTEGLVVTTAALHQHRHQRNARLGLAVGAAAIAAAAVVALAVVDRPTAAELAPAGPSPTSLASPTIAPEVVPRALAAAGISIATPPYWALTEDGPDVATFEHTTPDGHQTTAMAFIPGSVAAADGTLHPVPEDVRAWAATRGDLSIEDTGGMGVELGDLRYVAYDAPAGAPSLMCPEPPAATSCSVPPVDQATTAELEFFRDEAGNVFALVFYRDPDSPNPEIDSAALASAFHRP